MARATQSNDELDDASLLEALEAVRRGDFSVRLPGGQNGTSGRIVDAFNAIVELNEANARELRRISRTVGREGRIRQRAAAPAAGGEWARNVESVNALIDDLTEPTIEVGRVLGAVAKGDLSQRMAEDLDGRQLRGEYRRLARIVNTMVDQLNAFASEVTRVAREVGTEGKLGGQADVRGVGGTWKDLTDNVNQLAANLTLQVRAIGEVATAVTRGDLSRSIHVDARGELALLKDDLNEMIRNLRETTRKNEEQDWLKTNLARFSQRLQGERDTSTVARLTLSELASLLGVQRGAFFVTEPGGDGDGRVLSFVAGYATEPNAEPPASVRFGQSLVGQCAVERRPIHLTDVPSDYVAINSALGQAPPLSLVVLPIVAEDETLAIMELATFDRFRDIHLSFLEQVSETIGIVLNSIGANRRAEELVQEQAARAEAETGLARLRQVVDVMPEGILIADASGRVYLGNKASEDIMGLVPDLVIPEGDPLPSVRRLDGSPCPPQEHPLARAVFGGEVARGEQLVVVNAASGREVPILVNSAPLSDAQGAPAGGVAVFQDITQLRDLDRQMDEFLASLSHDLKTPATIIKGRAYLLRRGLSNGHRYGKADIAEGLEAIDESTAQLVRMVDELLDLTRLRMGQQFELDLGPTDVVKIARRLAAEYRNMSPRHAIRVESDVARLVGDWDEARIERVVANLISNGVRYSPLGGEITVSASREGADGDEFAVLRVRDNGVGIPAGELDRVFEPYYRATNVSGIGGTGLGLASTRHIVEQHGGTIDVESVEGESTTFTIRLPLIREPADLVEA